MTGRKKDLLITSGGKEYFPGNIEADLMNLPLVEHAVVVGDSRHFPGGAADAENRCAPGFCTTAWPAGRLAAMAHQPQVHAELQRGMDAVNARQARVAHIRRFSVIQDDFSIDNGCLTPRSKNPPQRGAAAVCGRNRSALPRHREPALGSCSTPAAKYSHIRHRPEPWQAQPLTHAHARDNSPKKSCRARENTRQ